MRLVAPLAGQLRTAATYGASLELQARLGHVGEDGGFAPGVPAALFARVEAALDASKAWSLAPPLLVRDDTSTVETVWQQQQHVIFDLEDGTEVRSVVEWHAADDGALPKSHVSKTLVDAVDMECTTKPKGKKAALAVRATITAEESVPTARLAGSVVPRWVGIKQRKVYEKAGWRFTLTRVWGGATNVEAEAAQMESLRHRSGDVKATDRTVHEIEVELVDASALLAQHGVDDAAIAHALLARALDFCGAGAALEPMTGGEGEGEEEGDAAHAAAAPASTMKEQDDEDMGCCVAPLVVREDAAMDEDADDGEL